MGILSSLGNPLFPWEFFLISLPNLSFPWESLPSIPLAILHSLWESSFLWESSLGNPSFPSLLWESFHSFPFEILFFPEFLIPLGILPSIPSFGNAPFLWESPSRILPPEESPSLPTHFPSSYCVPLEILEFCQDSSGIPWFSWAVFWDFSSLGSGIC